MEHVRLVIWLFSNVLKATVFLDTDILIVLDEGNGTNLFQHAKVSLDALIEVNKYNLSLCLSSRIE